MTSKMQKVIVGCLATFAIILVGATLFKNTYRIEKISIIGIRTVEPDQILAIIGFRPGEVLLASSKKIQTKLIASNIASEVSFQNNQLIIRLNQ